MVEDHIFSCSWDEFEDWIKQQINGDFFIEKLIEWKQGENGNSFPVNDGLKMVLSLDFKRD